MGACNNSLVAQLVESRTQRPEYMGSNHGEGNRLVDLAMKKNYHRVIAVWCRSSTQNRGENWENGKREQQGRENDQKQQGRVKVYFFPTRIN